MCSSDLNNGPFEYIPQTFTSQIVSSLKYRYGYVQDKTMEKVVSPSDFKSCKGIAGTVILASTGSIFHRGKMPIYSDRYTVFFDYTSRKPIVHNHYGASFLSDEQLRLLAKNLTPQQKECVPHEASPENRCHHVRHTPATVDYSPVSADNSAAILIQDTFP